MKADPGAFNGDNAAFIGHTHLAVPGLGREEQRRHEGGPGHEEPHTKEEQDRHVQPVKNHSFVPRFQSVNGTFNVRTISLKRGDFASYFIETGNLMVS